jgi:hypothetical protein
VVVVLGSRWAMTGTPTTATCVAAGGGGTAHRGRSSGDECRPRRAVALSRDATGRRALVSSIGEDVSETRGAVESNDTESKVTNRLHAGNKRADSMRQTDRVRGRQTLGGTVRPQ